MLVWRAVWRREWWTWRGYRFGLLVNLVGLALSVLPFFYVGAVFGPALPAALASGGHRGGYFPFVLVGLAFAHFLRSGLAAIAQQIGQEQAQGTLETLVAAPTPLAAVLTANAAAWFLGDCGFVAAYLVVGAWLGAPMVWTAAGTAALVLTAGLAAALFTGWGLAAAGLLLVVKRGNPLLWLAAMAFEVFGGVYCPISLLGEPWRTVGDWLPFSHVVTLARGALGLGPAGVADWANVVVWTGLSLAGGLLALRWGVETARATGQLGTT